jgi:predicted acylesterase/phospholipase RssA
VHVAIISSTNCFSTRRPSFIVFDCIHSISDFLPGFSFPRKPGNSKAHRSQYVFIRFIEERTMSGEVYDTVQALVATLISFKAANPTKKIAFVLSGGGARAAWFGGALESIERETRKQQPNIPADQRLAPDMIVGTSGGALAGLGYFADLMNSGSYGAYLNRQSWLWRDVANGNEGATLLLDNPEVLELLSGSKTGTSRIDWQAAQSTPTQITQAVFSPIANIRQEMSPTYNFEKLFQSRAELIKAKQDIKDKWDDMHAQLTQLTGDTSAIFQRIPQALAAPWVELINTAKTDVNNIKTKVDGVKADLREIKTDLHHAPPLLGQALDDVEALVKDSGGVIVAIIEAIGSLILKLADIPLEYITELFSGLQTLLTDLRNFLTALGTVVTAVEHGLAALVERIKQIALHIDDVVKFLATTIGMIVANSSLMNTSGLQKALQEVLLQATPTVMPSDSTGPAIDQAIFAHWKARRTAKAANPHVRAPELLLTASNITAGRLALLALCDDTTALALARPHSWVIALNKASTDVESPQTTVGPPDPRDPRHWIFGATSVDSVEPAGATPVTPAGLVMAPKTGDRLEAAAAGPSAKTALATAKAPSAATSSPQQAPATSSGKAGRGTSGRTDPGAPAPTPAIPSGPSGPQGTGGASIATPTSTMGLLHDFSPFPQPGTSEITGKSLLAMAALTSSAIPVAFPPKYWSFASPITPNTTWQHWFVDGGVCDNRPIQQALAAGADIIVSFELTPLRKAVDFILTSQARPNFAGVASDALIDTPITSSFYRFLETYVSDVHDQLTQNPSGSNEKKIWRISPDFNDGEETLGVSDTIGSYDFNGFWRGGDLKTGLFDWFMRGYLDTHGDQADAFFVGAGDLACQAYKDLPADYGQLKNANQKKGSPGFFRVDFVNNKPHPGYP